MKPFHPVIYLILAVLIGACALPASSPTRPVTTTMQPFVTATALRFDSWSPDSRWFAYWSAESEEGPATLAFAEVESGEICIHAEVTALDISNGDLIWQEDGSVEALLGEERIAFRGLPCEKFVLDDDFKVLDPRTWEEESPNGLYSAVIHIFKTDGPVFNTNLRITENETNKELFSFDYLDSAHTFFFGPRWLNNELYLIGTTLDQGILYFSITDNQVSHLLPDFLDLPTSEEENIWKIITQVDPIMGEYHLLFETNRGSLLLHSELDQVEELPFSLGVFFNNGTGRLWSFSPDGRWMLLSIDSPIHEGDLETWYRSVDPPGSEAVHFVVNSGAGHPPAEGQLMVLNRQGSVDLVSFPDGQLLSTWRAPGYYVDYVWRSPDGFHFVARGIQNETGVQSIFIFQP